jgi:hypothetical protein
MMDVLTRFRHILSFALSQEWQIREVLQKSVSDKNIGCNALITSATKAWYVCSWF